MFLDSGATSQKPQSVLDAVQEFYTTYNSNIHRGLYPIAEKATNTVEGVRDQVAQFINARHREEIIFTKSATESVNLVAYSLAKTHFKKDDIIVSTVMEHHANFVPWQQIAQHVGASFEVLDIDENYELDLENLKFTVQSSKVLALTYISNVLGTINPIKEIIKRARELNPEIIVFIDASQAAPHIPIDVQDLDCDFLTFTGHKMFAETGVGVLYGKKEILSRMQPFLFGGDMIREVSIEKTTFAELPNIFEAGTINIAGIISLGAAIEYIESIGFGEIAKHERELLAYSVQRLEKIEGLEIFGPRNLEKRIGIISFSLDGIHPHDVGQLLGEKQICVRASHHCAMPLHTRLGVPATTRVSLHIYNSREDLDRLVSELVRIKKLFTK